MPRPSDSSQDPSVDPIVRRITELGLVLPEPPRPVAAYVPCVRSGSLLFIAGQIPFRGGTLMAMGPVPSRTSVELAIEAARQCGLNALAIASAELGGRLSLVRRVVRLGVFVASDPSFEDHPKVADGASQLMLEVFGDSGRHARAAVGSPSLPRGASVEVEVLLEVSA